MAGSLDTDDLLRRIAVRQLGLVAVRQALGSGVTSSAIDRRRQLGLWLPVFRGVMRTAAVPPSTQQRTLAAALAVPGSTIIGPSAAIVDGLPLGPPTDPVVAVGPAESARMAGVRVVRLTHDLPTRVWHGVRVTTPSATLVMLPRFVSSERVERCLDHCLVNRLTTVGRVRSLLDSLPSRAVPGHRTLRRLLSDRESAGAHRSGVEMDVAGWLDEAGLVGWRANLDIPVGGGRSVEGDFVWTDRRVVLEASPFFTHGSRKAQERDVDRRRLLVAAGWRVVEAGDADLESEGAFVEVIGLLQALLTDRVAS